MHTRRRPDLPRPRGRHPGAVGPPTLTTVAEEAGVSRQTVSNALNNPELLRPETLARVQEVIERLGYSPNRAARQLRTRNSHLIGLRFEPAQGSGAWLMDRFLHSLVEAAAETGHHVLLFTGDPADPLDGYEDLMRATAVDAFVVTDTYAGTPQAGFLQAHGAPFVSFGRPWEEAATADWAWVDIDGAHGGRLATEHLLEQGHDRIAWLGWEKSSRIGQDRRSGWEAAMDAAGKARGGLGVRISDNVDHARMATHQLLEDPSITGFVCTSDTLAVGVLHACAERGLRPGRDIGVVGYDDSPVAAVTWPGLTSVRPPLEEVARELVRIMHQVLGHKPVEEQGRLVRPELVVRPSSLR